ncbi:MAG: hypothetical protein L3J28_02975 [Candidatus Polarisedimenticolaceae bacterium]|nr:hypothetical protein [Candidatus Polarisedimenticolaceae bacterium]
MKFEIAEEEWKKARIPHEIFITNMAGNHILMFVSALGMVGSYWQPLAMVPVISFCTLIYTLWRARQAKKTDSWFVMCHWQIAARRSRLFIGMLLMMSCVAGLGWVGYAYFGMMKIAAYATVGGVGILPTLVTVLILIVMESDAMHLAKQCKLPDDMIIRYPNDDVVIVEDIDYSAPAEQRAQKTST